MSGIASRSRARDASPEAIFVFVPSGQGGTFAKQYAERGLDKAGIKERKPTNNPQAGEPGKKAKERAEEKAEKAREAAEAAAAAAAAPAEEAPAAEAAAEESTEA